MSVFCVLTAQGFAAVTAKTKHHKVNAFTSTTPEIRPLRVAVHEAFFDLLVAEQNKLLSQTKTKTSFNELLKHVSFIKLRGDKLRLLINWGQAHKHYDLIIGIEPYSHSEKELSTFVSLTQKGDGLTESLKKDGVILKENIPKRHALIPFTYGILGFFCRKDILKAGWFDSVTAENPVMLISLSDFLAQLPDKSIVIQDESLSSVGSQTHKWLSHYESFPQKIRVKTKSWSHAYNMFKGGIGQCMVGYISSAPKKVTQKYKESIPIVFKSSSHPAQLFCIGIPKVSFYEEDSTKPITDVTDGLRHSFQSDRQKQILLLVRWLLSCKIQERLRSCFTFPVVEMNSERGLEPTKVPSLNLEDSKTNHVHPHIQFYGFSENNGA